MQHHMKYGSYSVSLLQPINQSKFEFYWTAPPILTSCLVIRLPIEEREKFLSYWIRRLYSWTSHLGRTPGTINHREKAWANEKEKKKKSRGGGYRKRIEDWEMERSKEVQGWVSKTHVKDGLSRTDIRLKFEVHTEKISSSKGLKCSLMLN